MDPRQEQFAQAFLRGQDRVFGFIVTMLPNRADAEEVFQQASLILWRKWDTFDPSADFVAWACGIARYEVLNYIRRADRRNVSLSPDVVELLSSERVEMAGEFAERRAALEHCIDRLPPAQRRLVEDAYAGEAPIHDLATRMGRSANALYLSLRRIRQALAECITRRVEEGGA